jgi:NAD(P)-dependent dehydrogenase (short-subunit alcohol dehydrogenase family)
VADPKHRRVALVTGSSRGIGRAIAIALAQDHDVIVQYRSRKEEAEAVAARIKAAGGRALICQADIADPQSLTALSEQGIRHFGRIDTLVTNAATGFHRPISTSTWQHVQDSLQIIAGSFVHLVAQVSPQMQAGGRIVAVSGLDQKFAVSDHGLIGAGKAALDSLVRNLAMELGPRGITVNSVVPGACRTDSMKRAMERKPGAEKPLVDCIPVGRVAEPEDIAPVVAFLCSPGAAYVNGTSILVDGGFSAGIIWTQQQSISLQKGEWSTRPLGQ